jgi:hypothetical protein
LFEVGMGMMSNVVSGPPEPFNRGFLSLHCQPLGKQFLLDRFTCWDVKTCGLNVEHTDDLVALAAV